MLDRIAEAIEKRQVLAVYYNGGVRIIEPHCCGYGADGRPLLRAYQVSGHSDSGNPSGWKLMGMDTMSNLEATGQLFDSPRPGYNPNGDKHMPTIRVKL
ncbi:MAG: hypothetical protein FD177_243 [Desulfovibrionaceae bacterium]|nr:MAG: hypothetical protein FD177_243 [Desulfovibrionaceae bacterium]